MTTPFTEAELVRQIRSNGNRWPSTMADCKRWGSSLTGSAWPLYLEANGANRHGRERPSHGVHVQFRPGRVNAELKDYTGDTVRMIEQEWTHRQWIALVGGTEQPTLFEDAS